MMADNVDILTSHVSTMASNINIMASHVDQSAMYNTHVFII